MKIILGSTSKQKISVVEKIAAQLISGCELEVVGYAAKSGVPDTPYDAETFEGAKNRASDSQTHLPGADCYIGLESGLVERYGHLFEEAWCVLVLGGREYYGYSSGLTVPEYVLTMMRQLNKPHSEVMKMIEEECGEVSSDTWGVYSGGSIARAVSLEEAVRNAFIQAMEVENSLYRKSNA